jgi:hypothetical protein
MGKRTQSPVLKAEAWAVVLTDDEAVEELARIPS